MFITSFLIVITLLGLSVIAIIRKMPNARIIAGCALAICALLFLSSTEILMLALISVAAYVILSRMGYKPIVGAHGAELRKTQDGSGIGFSWPIETRDDGRKEAVITLFSHKPGESDNKIFQITIPLPKKKTAPKQD